MLLSRIRNQNSSFPLPKLMLYNMYLAILLFFLSGALFLGLLVIIRVVCCFTHTQKKTKHKDQRNQKRWREGGKKGRIKRLLLGKNSTKKPGTEVLLNCAVHTNHQMLVRMQIIAQQLRRGLRFCIPNKLPGDVAHVGSWAMF